MLRHLFGIYYNQLVFAKYFSVRKRYGCERTSYTVPYDFSGFLPYVFTKYYGATEGETGAHQLKVNHESPTFTGCGTYNDPYIIPDGNTLVNIAKMMNSNSADDALSKIRLPKNSSDVVDLSLTWSAGYYEYDRNGSNFEYTGKTTFDLADVRTYMAGAYYKIGSDEITIGSSSGFTGLGNIGGEEDTFAVFRGVIVGTGTETIINQTNYPLIASSYGSVVRGLTIEVDSQIAKSNDTATNPFTPGTAENKCDYYGAVIGQIFGGDNIIDNVYVDFTDG